MNKTPVSMLQEMMAKKHATPNYELIHDGGGSHINTFTWQVTCDGLSATGTGRCKRDAKHEAAKAMLEAIAAHHAYPQLEPSPAQSPIRTPVPPTVPASPRIPPNVPFVNAIGALQLLCAEHDLEEPDYVPISDVGPPHAKVFTYHCVVATFHEEGIAATKKQAKHEAARKMCYRIMELIDDSRIPDDLYANRESEDNQSKRILSTEMAITNYHQLTKVTLTKKVNLGLQLFDAHLKLKRSMEESVCSEVREKLTSIHSSPNLSTEENLEETFNALTDILELLKLSYENSRVEYGGEDTVYLQRLSINTQPNITEIGIGKTESEAKLNVVLRVTNSLLELFE